VIGRLVAFAALTVAIVAVAGGGAASAQVCPPPPYPGDAASREAIAQWMAFGASAAGQPRELPVMGALVESGLRNLSIADADSAGYFQMRVGVWNRDEYAGFPEHPELQLEWFTDQAAIIRRAQLAAGGPDPGAAEYTWGEWIADVLRPAEQFRGRYQLRLGEARALIGTACLPAGAGTPIPPGTPPLPGTPPPPPSPPVADTVAPRVELTGRRQQRAAARGAVIIAVTCPAERCAAAATATLRLPGARRALRLTARPRLLASARPATLPLALTRSDRARVRRGLRSRPSLLATIRAAAVDAAGNLTVRNRTVRITG
jgi:hypothetical protein